MKDDFDVLFPDKREEHVEDTDLRQCQLILLRILKIIDYVCKKHNITYWLDSGTLLGAVRHGGFIPWDDDLDIAMTREDYERFLKIAPEELPEDLFVQNLDTTEFASNTWTQIKDRKSRIVLSEDALYHQGLYVDIFPMDSYSNNFFKRVFKEKIHKFSYIIVQAINAPFKKPFFKGINLVKNFIKLLLKIVFVFFAFFNHKVIYNLNIKSKDKRIEAMKSNPKTNYGYGTEVLNWDKVYKTEYIFPIKTLKFEDGEFNVPNNCHEVLKILYGRDYMELPPEYKRIQHNITIKPILEEEEKIKLNRGFQYSKSNNSISM